MFIFTWAKDYHLQSPNCFEGEILQKSPSGHYIKLKWFNAWREKRIEWMSADRIDMKEKLKEK